MLWFSLRRVAQVVVSLGVLAASPAFADPPTCVGSAAQLQAALTAAASDNHANHIGLVAGTYAFSTPLAVTVSDGFPLSIEGGYSNATCSGPPIPVADNTIISGVAGSGAFANIAGAGGLEVKNITFSGFKPAAGTNAVALADTDAGGMIHIENVTVTGNGVNGVNDHILAIYVFGGLLFDDNVVHDNAISNASVYVHAEYPGAPLTLANNTIAGNLGPGLALDTYSFQPTRLYNNILWNNVANDLILIDCHVFAMNNTWLNASIDTNSGLDASSANNVAADPRLAADYRLNANSPAINAGLAAPMALPLTDAGDNLRVVGSAPDQGAYESGIDDLSAAHTYLVTNTNDSGILSLRQAITDANASAAPARIAFHIGSTCGPQTIILKTPLPAITVPMLIDGYYQPGSTRNTLARSANGEVNFNAGICIFLAGDPTNKPGYGLRVADSVNPNVHLEVRGIVFTFFTQAAIDIAGGNGSWIHGNGFGESTTGSTFANNIGVNLHGGTAAVIGGPLAADANLIGNSHYTDGLGIRVDYGEHYATIANNNIGGNADGTGTGNQGAGILIRSTNHHEIRQNWVVANGGDGLRIDNSSYILAQSNTFGSIFSGLGNGGAGVHMLNGTYDVWLGTTDPQLPPAAGGNSIANNAGPGVWIDSDAGVFNQVTGNEIFSNGYLPIDLQQPGPTANSNGPGINPNHLLHKPVLRSAVVASGVAIAVKGTLTDVPGARRYLSFYASGRCGDASTWLGTRLVQVGDAGSVDFDVNVAVPFFSPAYVVATSETWTAGISDTSETSNSVLLSDADDIFNNGFDCY